jgi:DNA-binding MarR family transcriptional regulator
LSDLTYRALDEVIHGRVRLALMAFLSSARESDFGELSRVLSVTRGNLSVQLRILEDAGYVAISKGYRGRRPHTGVAITAEGDAALERYSAALRALLSRGEA